MLCRRLFKPLVPKPAGFHIVGICFNFSTPFLTCCCTRNSLPWTCLSLEVPSLFAICLVAELSTFTWAWLVNCWKYEWNWKQLDAGFLEARKQQQKQRNTNQTHPPTSTKQRHHGQGLQNKNYKTTKQLQNQPCGQFCWKNTRKLLVQAPATKIANPCNGPWSWTTFDFLFCLWRWRHGLPVQHQSKKNGETKHVKQCVEMFRKANGGQGSKIALHQLWGMRFLGTTQLAGWVDVWNLQISVSCILYLSHERLDM